MDITMLVQDKVSPYQAEYTFDGKTYYVANTDRDIFMEEMWWVCGEIFATEGIRLIVQRKE